MEPHPLFTLGGRLGLCASMVRNGARLADIGTDHGYLPVWLARQGRIARAVAADLRPGPLQKAQHSIERYCVQDRVTARLSDGLNAVLPQEVDDIVIAGMGGEMMIHIISGAPWLKNAEKHLILQPMTSVKELRVYLAEQGFAVLREQAVTEDGRVYVVLLACYCPQVVKVDELYPYIGRLDARSESSRVYLRKKIRALEKRARGLAVSGAAAESAAADRLVQKLNEKLKEGENDGDSR